VATTAPGMITSVQLCQLLSVTLWGARVWLPPPGAVLLTSERNQGGSTTTRSDSRHQSVLQLQQAAGSALRALRTAIGADGGNPAAAESGAAQLVAMLSADPPRDGSRAATASSSIVCAHQGQQQQVQLRQALQRLLCGGGPEAGPRAHSSEFALSAVSAWTEAAEVLGVVMLQDKAAGQAMLTVSVRAMLSVADISAHCSACCCSTVEHTLVGTRVCAVCEGVCSVIAAMLWQCYGYVMIVLCMRLLHLHPLLICS